MGRICSDFEVTVTASFLWPGRRVFILFLGLLALLIAAGIRLTRLEAFRWCAKGACLFDARRAAGFYVLFAVLFYLIYCCAAWGWRRLAARR